VVLDPDRLDLWARQLLVDAAKDRMAVAGDMATLQVLWDRAGPQSTRPSPRVTAALAILHKVRGQQAPRGTGRRHPLPLL
jgi:hypothetical protein